jgi:alkanesulfonate monooxygenase SsuD/methylene tetrahydromethanopterin reductase-like flavin-dependent oxidoreductase (luciferase family)
MGAFFGANRFKFGMFGLNCAGGMTLSSAPERWRADWDEIAAVAKMADEKGVEFLLPIAKWHGLGGDADMWGRSFETFTQAAALGAITEKIGLFVTAHVSLLTPAFVAKAIATIDHVTHGRAGVNIVCGWNPDEFAMHGVAIDPDLRYAKGLEWFRIYEKLLKGGEAFDWDGEFYKFRGLVTDPLPVQKPAPPVMSAAQSGDGQAFAAQAADILFSSMHSVEQVRDIVQRQQALAAQHGRSADVYVETQIVCRPTRKEAEDYAHYYAVEHADQGALDYFQRMKAGTLSKSTREAQSRSDAAVLASVKPAVRKYPGMFPGMYPLVGTPDDMVEQFARLEAIGVAGSALVFLNYFNEFPYFAQEVLPRMKRAGLRL